MQIRQLSFVFYIEILERENSLKNKNQRTIILEPDHGRAARLYIGEGSLRYLILFLMNTSCVLSSVLILACFKSPRVNKMNFSVDDPVAQVLQHACTHADKICGGTKKSTLELV